MVVVFLEWIIGVSSRCKIVKEYGNELRDDYSVPGKTLGTLIWFKN